MGWELAHGHIPGSTHYSTAYAVQRSYIKDTIKDFIQSPDNQHSKAHYGIQLNDIEQRRRYLIKSLTEEEQRLDREKYQAFFGTSLEADLPQLEELEALGLIQESEGLIQLNAKGLSYSDVIAPWLYSAQMNEKMQSFDLK